MSHSAPRNDNVFLRVIASEAKQSRDNFQEWLLSWFPKINANPIVVRLIDLYELRLPRRLRLLAMTVFSCVSLRAKRSNVVMTCKNDYICAIAQCQPIKQLVRQRP